jgi:hypothetical protein
MNGAAPAANLEHFGANCWLWASAIEDKWQHLDFRRCSAWLNQSLRAAPALGG